MLNTFPISFFIIRYREQSWTIHRQFVPFVDNSWAISRSMSSLAAYSLPDNACSNSVLACSFFRLRAMDFFPRELISCSDGVAIPLAWRERSTPIASTTSFVSRMPAVSVSTIGMPRRWKKSIMAFFSGISPSLGSGTAFHRESLLERWWCGTILREL